MTVNCNYIIMTLSYKHKLNYESAYVAFEFSRCMKSVHHNIIDIQFKHSNFDQQLHTDK